MPAYAWAWEAVSQLVNALGGNLVEILPATDCWCMTLTSWMRNPSGVPKEFNLEVPEPCGLPAAPAFSNGLASPPPPWAPTFRRTLLHPLIIHVMEVVDRTVAYMDELREFIDDDEDTIRKHTYPWWGGRVDGTGRGPARSGGHVFANLEMDSTSGGWGRSRSGGLLALAGGMPVEQRLQGGQLVTPTSSGAPALPPQLRVGSLSEPTPGALSTASAASAASTATGSTALALTTPSSRTCASPRPGYGNGLSSSGAPPPALVQRTVQVYTRRKKPRGRPPARPRPNELTEPVLGPLTASETIKRGLFLSPEPSILGFRPTVSAPVRRKKTIPQDFVPRRSERLIKKGDGKNKGPYHNAQCVLAKHLVFAQEDEEVTNDALEQYLKLFNKPLAPAHLRAIATMFAPDVVDFDEPAYSAFQAFVLPEEEQNEKELFLQELTQIGATMQSPWIVNGDFNLVTDTTDKSNGRVNKCMMNKFRHTINALALQDMHLQGCRFTWDNGQEEQISARLDRVLFNPLWEDVYPISDLTALSTSISDHSPLLLTCSAARPRSFRFKFENLWAKLPGFQEVVKNAWTTVSYFTNPLRTLDAKLKATAKSLRSWGQWKQSQLGLLF
ncbi:hypothetical protein ACQ4PT_002053 [Festuca glaucescens]